MAKNEYGEFELVLGNRQLLTVFFIVVVLFGIFFAMGYILGRPAGPATADAPVPRKAEKPLVVQSPASDSNPAPAPAAKSEPPPAQTPKPEPAKQAPNQEKTAAAKAEPPKPEPTKQAKAEPPPKPKPEPAKAAPPPSSEPASGTYLQLTATTQHEASLYNDVLQKKGFHAIIVPVPDDPAKFRVMVGPVTESNIGKTKNDLKAAGFPGDKAIKRTY